MVITQLLFVSLFAFIASKLVVKKYNRVVFLVTLSLGLLNLLMVCVLFGLGKTNTAIALSHAVIAFLTFACGHYVFYKANVNED